MIQKHIIFLISNHPLLKLLSLSLHPMSPVRSVWSAPWARTWSLGNKDYIMRLCHHVTDEKAVIQTSCFRQLRKVVSEGEYYFLWLVLWAFVTLQTIYMHKKST